jgi:heme/copper-type cytochrome/quinol oxidase subunit 2
MYCRPSKTLAFSRLSAAETRFSHNGAPWARLWGLTQKAPLAPGSSHRSGQGGVALPARTAELRNQLFSLCQQSLPTQPLSLFDSSTFTTESEAYSGHAPRSAFLPMREDVGSIRRLRVTKGLALPVDLPLHGVFGSKDVIHSWAVPGLGLKIDCIPGFNSHRRVSLR